VFPAASSAHQDGALADEENMMREVIQDSAILGTIPAGTNLEKMREKGAVRAIDWGNSAMMRCQQSPIEPNRTHTPWRNHVEQLKPFPTLTRRASFYIDHEWYLKAARSSRCTRTTPCREATIRCA
jgi:hypothetical protein